MKTVVWLFCLLLPLAARGGEKIYSLPQCDSCGSTVDGKIDKQEYQNYFTDPATGIMVFWQADSFNLQAALKSPGSGWLAIGLGSEKMNGADMVICFKDQDGKWQVEEHLGKAFFRHAPVEKPKLAAGKAATAEGRTILEFIMPLKLSNGQKIEPGKNFPFLLAYHKDRVKFSKHTKKSSNVLIMSRQASNPGQ
jgi:hypothetical protein